MQHIQANANVRPVDPQDAHQLVRCVARNRLSQPGRRPAAPRCRPQEDRRRRWRLRAGSAPDTPASLARTPRAAAPSRPAGRQPAVAFSRSLVTWGVFAGVTALYLLEPTGLARRDIFVKLPIVGGFWQKRLDALERKD
nr:hypothetical protein HK105_005487 [Polyrhizophydium stewartii]